MADGRDMHVVDDGAADPVGAADPAGAAADVAGPAADVAVSHLGRDDIQVERWLTQLDRMLEELELMPGSAGAVARDAVAALATVPPSATTRIPVTDGSTPCAPPGASPRSRGREP